MLPADRPWGSAVSPRRPRENCRMSLQPLRAPESALAASDLELRRLRVRLHQLATLGGLGAWSNGESRPPDIEHLAEDLLQVLGADVVHVRCTLETPWTVTRTH